MVCIGCGKKISLIGNVCPYCNRDKTSDVAEHNLLILIGVIGGIVGYLFSDGFLGHIAGIMLGSFISMLLLMIYKLAIKIFSRK